MVELFQCFLLILAAVLSLSGGGLPESCLVRTRIHGIAARKGIALTTIACITFVACIAAAVVLHEPVPRVHDEFSYRLMSDTFVLGRVANPTVQLAEFFDTFHVLMSPAYSSKYFPALGVFLAIGQ